MYYRKKAADASNESAQSSSMGTIISLSIHLAVEAYHLIIDRHILSIVSMVNRPTVNAVATGIDTALCRFAYSISAAAVL